METNNESNNIKNLLMPENEFINMYDNLQLTNVSLDTFIDESIAAYNNFTTKYFINSFLQFIAFILNTVFIFKASQSVAKIEEREKNDAILFDEETNIKV